MDNLNSKLYKKEDNTMTICFSCNTHIGFFKPRASKKEITRAGYVPVSGMSENDKLCQKCLDEIKRTQVQGKRLTDKVGMVGQIILCLIFPLLAFWRIEKTLRFLAYWAIIAIGITVIIAVPYTIDKDSEIALSLGVWIIVVFYIGGWAIPLYWIIKWTRQYNQEVIS